MSDTRATPKATKPKKSRTRKDTAAAARKRVTTQAKPKRTDAATARKQAAKVSKAARATVKRPQFSTTRKRTATRSQVITDDQIATALELSGGIKAAAARRLGCNRATVEKRISASPALTEYHAQLTETNIDIAEGGLVAQVRRISKTPGRWKDVDLKIIQFYLRTVGYKRGFGDRRQLEVTTPPALQVFVDPAASLADQVSAALAAEGDED